MDDNLPGKTRWETEQYRRSCGRHAAQAQAIIRLGLILETDEDSPAPLHMLTEIIDGKVYDTLWGYFLTSLGTEAGTAAVNAWAARHHVSADWSDRRYQAVMHLGGGYRYGARYVPAEVLYPPQEAPSAEVPVLAGTAAA